MADNFEKQKCRCLNQVDLSKKGSIDEKILNLVQHINSLQDYFTTSSCSGRICVFSENPDQKKKSGRWLFVSHDIVKLESLSESLNVTEESAVFKFEPFVMHVQCRSLEKAQLLLKVSLESGYKNSGIIIGKKQRFIVNVRSTPSLDVPIIYNGRLMVSNEYIQYLVELANTKMKENISRIQRLFENVQNGLQQKDACDKRGNQERSSYHENSRSQKSKSEKVTCDDMDDLLDSLAGFYEDHVS